MASYDDFSESSFGDSGISKDEPPTLDETLYDISLFLAFMNYMKSQQAAPSLQFIKQARLYKMLNVPRAVYSQMALKMIWTFFLDCSPLPVTVSADVKKKLKEIAFDPDAEVALDKDTFSVAFGEVYNSVVPHHRNWVSTNEWREYIPFHRIAPPSFSITLTTPTLRVLFNKFLKSRLNNDPDGAVAHAFQLWKFCIMANDFRDGKCSHASHLDGKKKKKDEKEDEEKTEEGEDKPQTPEEYAKRLYKKYKHHVSLPYDGSIPFAVYIVRALDHAIEEFDKSLLFSDWIGLKQYQGVDYQAKVVHQTLTEEGYAEPPTLAGAMASSMLPFFLVMMRGSEAGLNLEFLVDILKFRRTYESQEASSQTKSTSSSGSSKTEMIEEAKRIYGKYLDSGEMYCDPRLVEEVHNLLSKNAKGIKSDLFRKCGAFTYQRSEHTWAREARATFAWANKSYDNRCKHAHAIEEEFAMSVLPEGIDLQVVPTLDDTLACNALMVDYAAFCGDEINVAFQHFREAYEGYFKAPVHERKKYLENLSSAYSEITRLFPDLTPVRNLIEKEISIRERVSDSLFQFATSSILRAVASKYYANWLVEHSMVWKTSPWTPVPTITYSDLSTTFGMRAIEKKIEEAALKGKSGLSRFLAKRQVKKQSIANVRTAPARELSGPSKTVYSTKGAGDALAFGDIKGVSEQTAGTLQENVLVIPSITDTLSSTYLRKHFENAYLASALSASDMSLWEALCKFYNKYSLMEDERLIELQSNMLKDIENLCDKFKAILKDAAEVKERAKKQKFIFPQFFRPYETELYSAHHTEYEKALRAKGWK